MKATRIELPKGKKLPAPSPVVQGDLPMGLRALKATAPKSEPVRVALPMKQGTAKELREVTRPVLRQIAPGKWRADPGRVVPEYVLSIMVPAKDGTYEMRPMSGNLAKIETPLLQALGMVEQVDTLYRLARAGFIEIIRFTPQVSYLNLQSLYNHFARVAEDPEFWEEGKGNLEEYRRALA